MHLEELKWLQSSAHIVVQCKCSQYPTQLETEGRVEEHYQGPDRDKWALRRLGASALLHFRHISLLQHPAFPFSISVLI